MKESVIYQDILEQGLQQGLQREISLVLRQIKRRFGDLDSAIEVRIRSLSIDQLENLGEALLDFAQPDELLNWLDHNT